MFPWMPSWLSAIVFFFVGLAVERFFIDRRFLREVRNLHIAVVAAITARDAELGHPHQSEPPDPPHH